MSEPKSGPHVDPLDPELREIEAMVALTQERASRELDRRVERSLDDASATRRLGWGTLAAAAGIVALVGVGGFLLGGRFGWFGRSSAPAGSATEPADALLVTLSGAPSSRSSTTPHSLDAAREPRLRDDSPVVGHSGEGESNSAPEAARATAARAAPSREVSDAERRARRDSATARSEVEAFATIERATTIARLVPVGEPAPLDGKAWNDGRDGRVVARITGIYKGDPQLVGTEIDLRPGLSSSRESGVLARDAEAADQFWRPETQFVACLEEERAPRAGDQRIFRVALAEGYAVTLVSHDLPAEERPAGTEAIALALGRDLAASLRDPRAAVRISSITALRHFDELEKDAADRSTSFVWSELDVSPRLVWAARDVDPRVRWNAALLDPAAGGRKGVEIVRELLFDPVPLVREAAERSELRRHSRDVVSAREPLADRRFAERHSRVVLPAASEVNDRGDLDRAIRVLQHRGDPERRREAAEALAFANRLGTGEAQWAAVPALTGALEDEDLEVRRAAADSLGELGLATVVGDLETRAKGDDSRVAVAAAGAQLRLGDLRGLATFRVLTHVRDDARAVTQALHVIGELIAELPEPRRELVKILVDSFRSEEPLVRGEAIAVLASLAKDLEPDERAELDALLAQAANDPDFYVVLAAQAGPALMARSLAVPRPDGSQLEQLRAIGYVDDEDLRALGYGR